MMRISELKRTTVSSAQIASLGLIAAMTFLLALITACGSNDAGSSAAALNPAESSATVAAIDGSADSMLILNVWVDDEKISPAVLSIPVGTRVALVMRNLGSLEHHYTVNGLPADDALWLSKGSAHAPAVAADGTVDEMAAHHTPSELLASPTCVSRYGGVVCPTGEWVHAHAAPRGKDVVVFTASKTGTYEVWCALDSRIKGTVVVF